MHCLSSAVVVSRICSGGALDGWNCADASPAALAGRMPCGLIKFLSMRRVRPTLKVITQLPRESFRDRSVYDRVSQLKKRKRETRTQILSELRLYRLRHALLDDANSYFDRGELPDVHRAATQARKTKHGKAKPVYEVRDNSGAAWRGGVIRDDDGDPWLHPR